VLTVAILASRWSRAEPVPIRLAVFFALRTYEDSEITRNEVVYLLRIDTYVT
jgi:hypothetical protein